MRQDKFSKANMIAALVLVGFAFVLSLVARPLIAVFIPDPAINKIGVPMFRMQQLGAAFLFRFQLSRELLE